MITSNSIFRWLAYRKSANSSILFGCGLAKKVHSCALILSFASGFSMLVGLAQAAATTTRTPGYVKSAYVLPSSLQKSGFKFCGETVPLTRRDVYSRVTDQLNFLLMDRRSILMEWFDRMAIFGPSILEVLAEEKTPNDLIYVSVLLSGLTPNARLKSGGVGWWAIGSANGKKDSGFPIWVSNEHWDDRKDFVISTRIACKIFKDLFQRPHFKSWPLAISAFLDGSDKLEAIVKKFPGFSYWDIVTPPLSDAFIPQVVALKIIHTNREFYSLQTPSLNPASYDVIDRLPLLKDLPLYLVAKWCHISPRSLWEMNPAVDISSGILPKTNSKNSPGLLLRVPKGKAAEIKSLLIKEGYISSSEP